MRIRSIKPEFWQDERLATVSLSARLLFVGLWNLADDFGVLRGNPRLIRGQLFPYDAIDVEPLLAELERARRIVRYRPDGEDLVLIRNFTKHQKLDRRIKSRPPLPAGYDVIEIDAPDAEGKPGRAMRVVEVAPAAPTVPANSQEKSAEPASPRRIPPIPADSRQSPPNPAVGRDGTGRDGTGVGPRPVAASGNTSERAIAFFVWADEQRRAKFPKAMPDPRPLGYEGWYAGALASLAGDESKLRSAWLRWLDDDWGRKRKTPCPISAFIADRVWFQHVPGQDVAADGSGGDGFEDVTGRDVIAEGAR
jgi:hypothetical protein